MTRYGIMLTTSAAVAGVALSAFIDMPAKLMWNASGSVPLGLYFIEPIDTLKVGALVAVDVPETLAGFIAERRYLPRGVPLLKHVAALPGQRVCRLGTRIIIDGVAVAEAREHDRLDRALPSWQGCRRINEGEVFLLNAAIPDSLDGRYFGLLPLSSVIGRARPLWTEAVAPTAITSHAPAQSAFPSITSSTANQRSLP